MSLTFAYRRAPTLTDTFSNDADDVAGVCRLLELKDYQGIELLLRSDDKWKRIVPAAVRRMHGVDKTYTQHGITESLAALPRERRRLVFSGIQRLCEALTQA